jgi:two-component system, OmpR family, response regulator
MTYSGWVYLFLAMLTFASAVVLSYVTWGQVRNGAPSRNAGSVGRDESDTPSTTPTAAPIRPLAQRPEIVDEIDDESSSAAASTTSSDASKQSRHLGTAWEPARAEEPEREDAEKVAGARTLTPAALVEDTKRVSVMVVDDEPLMTELISTAFRGEGWEVSTAGDGATALALARKNPPDAVVLDVMLPGMSGLDVVRKLREGSPHLPLLLLTAHDSVEDQISGLTAGDDDYVTKPFSLEEVVLRLRALLRRPGVTNETGGDAKIIVGDLVLDEDSHEVTRGGELIPLTANEFGLLRFMMLNSKRVLSNAQILDQVWSYDFGGRPNFVEVYVSDLRKKIDSGREPMIHRLQNAGYVLTAPDSLTRSPETG